MNNLAEIREHAAHLYHDLEELRSEVEHSTSGPDFKSSVAREICESQARVQRVMDACPAVVREGAAVLEPVTALAVVA